MTGSVYCFVITHVYVILNDVDDKKSVLAFDVFIKMFC